MGKYFSSHGNCFNHFFNSRGRPGSHTSLGFWQEILYYYFLYMPEFFVKFFYRLDGAHPLIPCLTYTNKNTGSKWDLELACIFDSFQALTWNFSRASFMRIDISNGFQHKPHARIERF